MAKGKATTKMAKRFCGTTTPKNDMRPSVTVTGMKAMAEPSKTMRERCFAITDEERQNASALELTTVRVPTKPYIRTKWTAFIINADRASISSEGDLVTAR